MEVHVCPNCGANINLASMKCDDCGYVFQGIDVPSIVKEFQEKVNSASFMSRSSVIRQFPIPNSQEALFAFIDYLHPLRETGSFTSDAYNAKFQECFNRAKVAFPDHPKIQMYSNMAEEKKREEKKNDRTAAFIFIGIFAFIIAVLTLAIHYGDDDESNQASTIETLATDSYEEEGYTEVETIPIIEEKIAAEVKLPKGWEKMYMMSGKYEYCAAEFSCSGATFSVEIYKDGIVVNFVPKKGGEDKITNLKIGKVTDFATSDITGVATFKFYDEHEVAAIADYMSSGKNEAYVEQEGEVYKVKLSGKAAKNIIEAIKWAQANPIAMEIL